MFTFSEMLARWSSLKAVSVPTSVIGIGGLRSSTAASDLVDVCHRGHFEGLSMQMSASG